MSWAPPHVDLQTLYVGTLRSTGGGGCVRGRASTEEEGWQKQQNGPYGIIARIQDRFLSDPQTDRQRLTTAVDHLLSQGLSVKGVRALFSGLDRLKRPFPALMFRMRGLEAAQTFLTRTLGRGVNASGPSSPQLPTTDDVEPFSRPERFLLDSWARPRTPARSMGVPVTNPVVLA